MKKNKIRTLSIFLWTFFFVAFYSINGYSQGMGIAIATPISVLHVYESTTKVDATAGLTVEQASTGDAVIQFLLTGGQRWVAGIDNSDADKFKISSTADVGATPRITFLTTGEIGIGVTAPVAGTAVQIGADNLTSGGTLQVNVNDGDAQSQGVKASVKKTTGTNYGVNGTAWGVGATQNTALYGWAAGATTNWGLYVEAGDTYLNTTVGIGTTTPQNKLDVEGSVVIGATYSGTTAAPANGLLVEGLSGIAQTAPEQMLHVGDNTGSTNNYILVQTTSLFKAGIQFQGGAGGYWHVTHDNNPDILQFGKDATEFITITNDGRIYGSALHNNAGAVTGATNQYIASGTYTPTLFNTTNVAASTASVCQWMRVGNVVTVSGKVAIDATSCLGNASVFGMSLPIASALTAAEQCVGYHTLGIPITGDAANDRVIINWTSVNCANTTYYFSYTYLIL